MRLPRLLLACPHIPFWCIRGQSKEGTRTKRSKWIEGKGEKEREREDLKTSQQALTAKLTTSKTFPSQQRLNQNPIPPAYELEEQSCDYD